MSVKEAAPMTAAMTAATVNDMLAIVSQLARCDKKGKDITIQRLIVDARKLCGWPKKDLLR